MTEKEKMERHMLYDANYDDELTEERLYCKTMCREYNLLPIRDTEKRQALIKKILGKTGENICIEPDFWCDYGYKIKVGENFYANHGLVILDGGGVTFVLWFSYGRSSHRLRKTQQGTRICLSDKSRQQCVVRRRRSGHAGCDSGR